MRTFDSDILDAPQSADLALLAALAEDLRLLHFTTDGVAILLGTEAADALAREQAIPARLQCRSVVAAGGVDASLAGIVLLWLLGESIPEQLLIQAFPRTTVAGLRALRLVEAHDGGWRASVDLRPHSSDSVGELWVASDLGSQQRSGVLRRDHVLGIGHASLTLAQVTVRRPVGAALDLGTGCGIQAFHLLAHAEHVTVTDISERALAFTRFNLLLNAGPLRIEPTALDRRVTLLQGSLLEPVAGRTFDLVVSNPPFVITPRENGENAAERFTYRDGGMPGDGIMAALLQQLPGVLTPGGTAQLLGNWEVHGHESWQERLASWISSGTDVWVIRRELVTPALYAETWLRDASESRDPVLYEAAFADYLRDFGARGVEAVGFGIFWLRRQPEDSGETLNRFEDITYPVEQPLGAHLADAIDRYDWVEAHQGDLEQQHLLVADDVTEERHQRPGAEHPGVILLRQGAGLRRTNLMSTELTGFVSACDGDLAVGQLVAALAALLERDDPEFRTDLLAEVQNLVLEGFLVSIGTDMST